MHMVYIPNNSNVVALFMLCICNAKRQNKINRKPFNQHLVTYCHDDSFERLIHL